MIANEFARPIPLDRVGEAPREERIAAVEGECAALARRFGLVAIDRLEAIAAVRRDGETVYAEGRIVAAVTQRCVATGGPLPASVDEPFALRFAPASDAAPEELELDAVALDTIDYEGAAIDLGEAVAETLMLALDPFPRAPDADAALRAAGIKAEGEVGAFSALAALRAKLGATGD